MALIFNWPKLDLDELESQILEIEEKGLAEVENSKESNKSQEDSKKSDESYNQLVEDLKNTQKILKIKQKN